MIITNHSADQSPAERLPLTTVSSVLDAALRMWDRDHIEARSQVRAAAAMLRSYADNRPAGSNRVTSAPKSGGLAPWQARKVREYIETTLTSTIKLKDCADIARLSSSYFSHAFKITFGTNLRYYIQQRRVEQAKQRMLLSKEPLSHVALACGFSDQAHYCRVFRHFVGSSPSAWRREHRFSAPGE